MQTKLRRLTRVRFLAAAALLAAISLAWPGAQPGRAWPGGVDGGFAEGGGTIVDTGGSDSTVDMAALSNGGTVTLISAQQDVAVLRLDDRGARDPNWGEDGLLRDTDDGYPIAVGAQADGKVVVVADTPTSFAMKRYLADGTPDPTFGVLGRVEPAPYASQDEARALAIQPDGKIVIAGLSWTGAQPYRAIFRFNADGSRDLGFGDGGRAAVDQQGEFWSVLVQPDGGIVGGVVSAGGGPLVRVTSDGTMDESFGTAGAVSTVGNPWTMALAHDGTLLYGGRVGSSQDFRVYRVRADGGDAGASAPLPAEPRKIVATPAGQVLVVGSAQFDPEVAQGGFSVARLTTGLAPDPTFGDEGIAVYAVGPATDARDAVVQSNGTIVVGGVDQWRPNWRPTDDAFVLGIRSGPLPLGFMLDGWGGLHPLSSGRAVPATTTNGAPYWKGWDIARGVALKADQTGGYELDGWGGIHAFGVNGHAPPARVTGGPYWRDWDIARDIAILPDETGGYILDGWGGLHPFGLDGHAPPPRVTTGPYWTGWDIARGVALLPDGTGGYVLDGWGGIHPFAIGDFPPPDYFEGGPYWQGWDIARDIELYPFGGAYVLDGWGGVHGVAPYEGYPLPPSLTGTPYWKGWDIARSISIP